MARRTRLLALALAAPLLLSACSTENSGGGDSSSGSDSGNAADGDLTFAVVTHGAAGDAFWDVVQTGAEAAGEDLGVSVDYQSDGDPQRQSQLIEAAVKLLQVDINDLQAAQSTITSQLQSDTSIDAVLTLNSAVAAVAATAASDAGSDAAVATFDLNGDVISAIQDGTVAFAVDQQQYEQGYLPIVMLKLYAENLNTVGGGQPVLTGPGIVDATNVDEIADLASAGTR